MRAVVCLVLGCAIAGCTLQFDPNLISSCPTDVLLCDGFEDPAVSLTLWPDVHDTINGTYEVDTTRAYRGASSFHAHGNQVTSTSSSKQVQVMIGTAAQTALMPPQLYVRAFVFAPAQPQADQLAWAAINEDDVSKGYPGMNFGYASMTGHPYYDNEIESPAMTYPSSSMLPFDQWVCLEWEVILSMNGVATSTAEAGGMDAWFDGVEIDGLKDSQQTLPIQPPTPPPAMNFQIGLFLSSATMPHDPYDLWIDEVIVDSNPIGCAK